MTENRIPYGRALPDTWTAVPLKYLATLTNGYVFTSSARSETGTPIIRIENLNGSPRFNLSELNLPSKYQVDFGDLLFSWSGNPGTSFGPYRWNKSGKYYLNQHIFKVGVFGCDPRWLYWALKAATHWIERELTSGMIGMVHITKDDLSGVPIPVPPIEAQRRIANSLEAETSRIDRLISLQRRSLDLLDERDNALRDQLLDQLSTTTGLAPLRRFTTRIEQGASPQCDAISRLGTQEWGVLKLSAVKRGKFDPAENKRLPDDVPAPRGLEVRPGDLLVTRANTPRLVGDVAVANEHCERLLLPDLIYRVGLLENVRAEFIAAAALGRRIRSQIEAVARGSSQSMVKLRGEDIKAWPIPRATPRQQDDLVAELRAGTASTEHLRDLVRRQLTLLAERRQALITAAVTGQFDVSTASGRNVTDGVSA